MPIFNLRNCCIDASMKALRKLLSIALLAVFGLPFVSPLFAFSLKSDRGVAACCRRNGKHQCMMSAGERASVSRRAPAFSAPTERCPFRQASFAVIHGEAFAIPVAQAVYAGLIAHPAVVAQTESKLRISRGRSRQKRGPPASLFL
jgi:hypothetical protein